MAKKRRRLKQPEQITWWAEWEHPKYGIVQVTYTWERTGPGTYRAIPIAVQFDLFCPARVQERMTADLKALNIKGVFNA